MKDEHVVDEAHVPFFHRRPDFMLFCYKVQRVQGFSLRFSQTWDARCARIAWWVSDKTAT